MALEARSSLVLQLLHLGKQIGYLLERRLALRGVNRTHALVLFTLSHHPGLKALELCEPARVEPANITRTLQALGRRGLLERRPHPTDGRAGTFYLTTPGEILAVELLKEVDRLSSELFHDLEPGETTYLKGVLGSLRGAVSHQLSDFCPEGPDSGRKLSSPDPVEALPERGSSG